MLYYYTARDSAARFVRGSLEAANVTDALAALGSRTLFISSLDAAVTVRGTFSSMFQLGSVSQQALVAFFRSLATLVRAGVSLPRSLSVCIDQCSDNRLGEALRSIASEIKAGLSLSESMLKHPREFSPLSIGAIKTGECGGKLDEVLGRLAGTLERDRILRKKLTASLTYPCIVVSATIVVTWLLLTTTIPIFENMYLQLQVQMPPILRVLVAAGGILRSTGLVAGLIAGVCCAAVGLARYGQSVHGAATIEKIQFALPIVGTIVRKAGIARLARLLGMLLGCGISLHEAIPIVVQATGSPRLCTSLEWLQHSLAEGSSIAAPLQASGMYDSLFIQLVRVGEETGAIDEMLLRVAEYYELDVETALQQLGSALEPLMIVVLGGIVGAVAAAVFIPLYSLIGSMK